MKYDDGLHHITSDEYHSSEGLSRSALWAFKRSPAHYLYQYGPNAVKKERTASMILGDIVHTMVLEPKEFDARYYVRPDNMPRPSQGTLAEHGREEYDRRKALIKEAKEHDARVAEQVEIEAGDRLVITTDVHAKAFAMTQSLVLNDVTEQLIETAAIENSIYFTHKETGVQCKARPDALLGDIVTDLKTTASAEYRDFQSSAYRYGYYLQAAMIRVALDSLDIKMDRFYFLLVEKEAPFATTVYALDNSAIDYGWNMFNSLMRDYAECLEKDSWPSYPAQLMFAPAYADKD